MRVGQHIVGSFSLVQIISFADRFPAAINDAFASNSQSHYPGCALRLIPIPQLVALKLSREVRSQKQTLLNCLGATPIKFDQRSPASSNVIGSGVSIKFGETST